MDVDVRGAATRNGRQPAPVQQPVVPPQEVPATVAALPVAETALRQVLASRGRTPDDPKAVALDLLRSVEALLRASAPEGTSSEEIGSAAAQLIQRQGLLTRLGAGTASDIDAGGPPAADAWQAGRDAGAGAHTVDTRL